MDSAFADDAVSQEVIAGFTDGLMRFDHDGNAVPALAESYEVNDDAIIYTFSIRDAKWSNGDKVTANDFVYALRRLVDPALGADCSYMVADAVRIKNAVDILAGRMDLSELGVRAKDDSTLVIELERPCPYLLSMLTFPAFYPVNEKFCESCGETYATSYDTVLSCGAFILDRDYAVSSDSFSMSRNNGYWDSKNVSVEKLSYRVIADCETALKDYTDDKLDMIFLDDSRIEQFRGNSEFFRLYSKSLWYLSLNISGSEFLQNIHMRRALAAAFDRELLCRNIVRNGVPAYYSVPSGIAVGPLGIEFTMDCAKWDYGDLEDARIELSKAMIELGSQSFVISLLVEDNPDIKAVADYIQSCWNKLDGVNCSVIAKSRSELTESLQNGTYVVCLTRFDADCPDPLPFLEMFRSGSEGNYGKWSDDLFDVVINSVISGHLAHDFNKRWMGLLKAENLIMDNMVMIPVLQPSICGLLKTGISGVDLHSLSAHRIFKYASFK
ncbi:MAG: peptide ABC transporter substrate-binding protein [Dehalococcoidales bacterium]|nr:peptide ABC transporter substrate-binding protein [Dehalococcoidales bacterium]